MGRFSKLETGAAAPEEKAEEEFPRVRRSATARNEAADSPGPDYDQGHYLSEGDRLFYNGEYQKALRSYSRAMQVDHSAVEPWMGQVLSLVQMKQYRESAVWALRSLELFPEDPRLISLQGLTLALTGSVQRALSCSDYAISRPTATSAFVWALRGQILSLCNNPNASFCFDKAMELRQKDDWQILTLVGQFLLAEKKWSRAAEFLKEAVQINPCSAFLWKRLGIAQERLGLTQGAMEAYTAALHLDAADKEAEANIERLAETALPVRIWRRLFGG